MDGWGGGQKLDEEEMEWTNDKVPSQQEGPL